MVFVARRQPAYPSTKQGQATGLLLAWYRTHSKARGGRIKNLLAAYACIDKRGPGQSAQKFPDRHGERGGPLVDSDTHAKWVSAISETHRRLQSSPSNYIGLVGARCKAARGVGSAGVHSKHERHSSAIQTYRRRVGRRSDPASLSFSDGSCWTASAFGDISADKRLRNRGAGCCRSRSSAIPSIERDTSTFDKRSSDSVTASNPAIYRSARLVLLQDLFFYAL